MLGLLHSSALNKVEGQVILGMMKQEHVLSLSEGIVPSECGSLIASEWLDDFCRSHLIIPEPLCTGIFWTADSKVDSCCNLGQDDDGTGSVIST